MMLELDANWFVAHARSLDDTVCMHFRNHACTLQLLLHGKSSLTWHLDDAQWQLHEKFFNHIADINDRCAGY